MAIKQPVDSKKDLFQVLFDTMKNIKIDTQKTGTHTTLGELVTLVSDDKRIVIMSEKLKQWHMPPLTPINLILACFADFLRSYVSPAVIFLSENEISIMTDFNTSALLNIDINKFHEIMTAINRKITLFTRLANILRIRRPNIHYRDADIALITKSDVFSAPMFQTHTAQECLIPTFYDNDIHFIIRDTQQLTDFLRIQELTMNMASTTNVDTIKISVEPRHGDSGKTQTIHTNHQPKCGFQA